MRSIIYALTLGLLAVGVSDLYSQGKDQSGDPLPAGALARMGTLRLRHGDAINFVAYPRDGKSVLTAGDDNTVRLWDRKTGQELHRYTLPAAGGNPGGLVRPVNIGWGGVGRGLRVALSPDGKLVAIALPSNVIQIWSTETGKGVRQIKGPQNGIASLAFSPDGKMLAARGGDRATYLLETETGKELHKIQLNPQPGGGAVIRIGLVGGGSSEATGVAFAPKGKTIATAEVEFAMQKTTTFIRITDTETGKELRRIDTTPGGTSGIAYSPDGKLLALGMGNSVSFRDPESGKEVRSANNTTGVVGLAFAPDGKTLGAKGRDQAIRLIETETAKVTQTLGDATPVANNLNVAFLAYNFTETRDVAFSHDSKLVATGAGQTLRVWDVGTGKEQPLAGGHRGTVSAVALSPDGKTMLTRGNDKVLRRWNAHTGAEINQFEEPRGTTGVLFSPDGKTAALANSDGTIRLHAVDTGKELHQLKGHTNGAAALAFSRDGKSLASRGNNDNTIRLYDVVKGTNIRQITLTVAGANPAPGGGFGGGVYANAGGLGLAFSPDGQSIAINVNAGGAVNVRPGGQPAGMAPSGSLRVFDIATGKEIRQITLPVQRIITSIAYSPDGRILAAENSDQTISLWELASGRERAVLGKPLTPQPGMAGGGFSTVRILGGARRDPLADASLAFSPDGGLIAMRNAKNIRVWEVDHAQELKALQGHDGLVTSIAFAPDGKTLASGSADTTALVWDIGSLALSPKPAPREIPAAELDTLWADLIGDDAGKAGRSLLTLASSPKAVAPMLRERVKPAAAVDVKKIDQWLADLNSSNFPTRTRANQELERLGELAIPGLRKVLDAEPSLEARRRMETLLEKLTTGVLSAEQVRTIRAIESLEKMGSADARAVLEHLTKGAAGALTTRHAQAALARTKR